MAAEIDPRLADLRIGPFRVHALREGDKVAGGSVPWSAAEQAPSALGLPTIEFYDERQDKERFTGGQFVTSYYLETLLSSLERMSWRNALVLDGDVPSWVVSGSDLKALDAWLEQVARSWLPALSEDDRAAVLARHPQLTPGTMANEFMGDPVFEVGFQEPDKDYATVVLLPCPKSTLEAFSGMRVLWASDRMSFEGVDGDDRGIAERLGLTLRKQAPEDLNLLAAAFPWQEATRDVLRDMETLRECEALQSYRDEGGKQSDAFWWASAALRINDLPVDPYTAEAMDWEKTPEGRYGVTLAEVSGDLDLLESAGLDDFFDFEAYGEHAAEANGVSCGTRASVDLVMMPPVASRGELEGLLPDRASQQANEPLEEQARAVCAEQAAANDSPGRDLGAER